MRSEGAEFFAAIGAEPGGGSRALAAIDAILPGPGVPVVNDQVSDVWDPGEGIGEDENRIPLMEPVNEEEERPNQAEPPESQRYHHLFLFFRGMPLEKKPGKENQIADPSDDFPSAPFDAQKLSVVPEKISDSIHTRGRLTRWRRRRKG